MERVPYQATRAAAAYDGIERLPVVFLLDDVRSMYNVGAFFRTADAAALESLELGGITACPPQRAITKTALGAEETVPWRHHREILAAALDYRGRGYELAAVETSLHSVDLFEWRPHFPVCMVFGHEVDGVKPELLAACDTHVRIPMLGRKHSLNVATAAGVVAFELLRKYRSLVENRER
ncbi:MAG: RNA methyltransferase [Bryobacterales bacterium]|nr:RNA methyltransferase [Bryobacterales bacterium]